MCSSLPCTCSPQVLYEAASGGKVDQGMLAGIGGSMHFQILKGNMISPVIFYCKGTVLAFKDQYDSFRHSLESLYAIRNL